MYSELVIIANKPWQGEWRPQKDYPWIVNTSTNAEACAAASMYLLAIANYIPWVPAVPVLLSIMLKSRLESYFVVLVRSFVSHQGSALHWVQSADGATKHLPHCDTSELCYSSNFYSTDNKPLKYNTQGFGSQTAKWSVARRLIHYF